MATGARRMTISDKELEALFNPTPQHVPNDPHMIVKELRDKGFAPMRYARTARLVVELGVRTIYSAIWVASRQPDQHANIASYTGNEWAETWFVRVCECEPVPLEAREQIFNRLRAGGDDAIMLRNAFEALASLTDDHHRFASLIVELWEREP